MRKLLFSKKSYDAVISAIFRMTIGTFLQFFQVRYDSVSCVFCFVLPRRFYGENYGAGQERDRRQREARLRSSPVAGHSEVLSSEVVPVEPVCARPRGGRGTGDAK